MRRRNSAVPLIIALIAIAAPLRAGSSSAEMNVSAHVIARTILTIDNQPSAVNITADDISRGYIDVPQAVAFHIRSNARDGFTLSFQPIDFPFSAAEVQWGGQGTVLQAGNAWSSPLIHPYQQGTSVGSLAVRLRIVAGATPGSYAWPVQFEANSL